MDHLKRFLAASELMKSTREFVGAQTDVKSNEPEHRLANGALAIAQAELDEAKKNLLEHIEKEGLPALERTPDERRGGMGQASVEHWLQQEADEHKRQVFMRWGRETLIKKPKSASGSVAFAVL